MKKKLKDYLHLYIGCEIQSLDGGESKYIFCGYKGNGEPTFKTIPSGFAMHLAHWKPILRRLCDMTKDEREMFGWQDESEFRYLSDAHQVMKNYYYGWQFFDLLKLHFDLFGLIESGLAIDKSTLKK